MQSESHHFFKNYQKLHLIIHSQTFSSIPLHVFYIKPNQMYAVYVKAS